MGGYFGGGILIRPARDDEHTDAPGEARFVFDEEGEDKGFVCLSRIQNKNGLECWVHDLNADGVYAAALIRKARLQAREWGFEKVWANVCNPQLAVSMRDHGWQIEQVLLTSPEGWVDGKRHKETKECRLIQ